MTVVVVQGGEWWDTAEVAAYLGVAAVTVSAYRNRGQMPEPIYVGRIPLWRPDEIKAWAETRRRTAKRSRRD